MRLKLRWFYLITPQNKILIRGKFLTCLKLKVLTKSSLRGIRSTKLEQ